MRDGNWVCGSRAGLGCVVALSLAIAPKVGGQDTVAAEKPKLLTPQASLNIRSIADLQFSPDGGRLAFVVTELPKGTGRLRHVWIYDNQSGTVRQFTVSEKSEFSPRWSPVGKRLAFLSDRGEDQQIYVMRADGGEGV